MIDFESVVIDGDVPPAIRERLVAETAAQLEQQESRGVTLPDLRAGSVGPDARAAGAAALPIISQFLLNSHTGRG